MKTESFVLADKEKQHIMRRKSKQTQTLNFLSVFSCSSNMLIHLFHLHWFASGVRPLFEAHPKMGTATFVYLHIVLVSVHSRPYLCHVPEPTNFKTQFFTLLQLAVRGRTYPPLHRRFGTS